MNFINDYCIKKILFVENNETIANRFISKFYNDLGYEYTICETFSDVKKALAKNSDQYFVAILHLLLEKSNEEKILDFVISYNIPVIVVTSIINDNIREQILNKKIFDYIINISNGSIDLLVKLVHNIWRNLKTKVLVVDDSIISRQYLVDLLEKQCLIVLAAESSAEALNILKNNPDIKMVITDYNMPEKNGIELLNQIRLTTPIDKMVVIGISAYGNSLVSTTFLKEGANDFIYKPFSEEEFKWRINQNIEFLETINILRDIATKDALTGLYNRHTVYDIGKKLFENTKRGNIEITVGMIDIDNFKSINDIFGHYSGDLVIQKVAEVLQKNFRASDMVARYGGDEFCIIAVNLREVNAFNHFEKIRKQVAALKIFNKQNDLIAVTISIGAVNHISTNIDETFRNAYNLLYKAKKNGCNNTVIE